MAAPSPIIRRIVLIALTLITIYAVAADETGQPAPRFRAKTTAGDQFNNASVKGKVVLFEFWTTWCQYCEAEAELVDDIAKEFSDKGLIVLAVDVLEPDKTVKKYLIDHPRSVPIVLTKDTNLAAMYNARRQYCRGATRRCGRKSAAAFAKTGRDRSQRRNGTVSPSTKHACHPE